MAVDSKKFHTIQPVIQGHDQLIQKSNWQCEIVDQDISCPYQEFTAVPPIWTVKNIPADYLPQD